MTATCSQCGGNLAGSLLDSRCPSCLLWLAMEEEPGPRKAFPAGNQLGPKRFGDYELLEEIARGGMGAVYRARQISLNRIVAVKMILAGGLASAEAIRRFRAEAEAAASLQHPNIVAIHEVGECDGHQFFSMDYVEGESLTQAARDKPLPTREAASYLKTIAEAVHYAHQQGVLHRDLKPSNVLIDPFDQPRILDFGLAKRLSADSDLTLSGQALGSPNFMPPEQAEGRAEAVGPASDVYSLGALLYYLITSRPPFQAETLTALLKQVAEVDPVSPKLLNPNVPKDLETICLKCLEKEPRRRYGSARELAEELGRFLKDEPILARPLSSPERLWRWRQRHPARAGLIGALALVSGLGLGGILWQWRRADLERTSAQVNERMARRYAYAADMNLAQKALEAADLGRAWELLNRYRSKLPGEDDPRGWEWRYLWKLCQTDEQSTLCRDTNTIGALVFSPDGKYLASRQGDQVVVRDWATRREAATFPAHRFRRALAFSPDGRLLATVRGETNSIGSSVNLWEIATQKQVARLAHSNAVAFMVFSSAGKLATVEDQGLVRLWDTQIPQVAATNWATPFGGVSRSGHGDNDGRGTLAFSRDGALLAIGETWGRIKLWDWATGRQRWIDAPVEGDGVTALAFSPTGELLVAGYGYADPTIRLWDVQTLTNAGELVGHKGWVSALAFAPGGERLASSSGDQTIRLWDLAQRKPFKTLRGHTHEVWSVAFTPDGSALLSGGKDGSIRVWDAAAKPTSAGWLTLSDRVWRLGLAFTPDSQTLYTVADLTARPPLTIRAWDPLTGAEKRSYPGFGTNAASVAVSPDGRLLAVGEMGGSVKVWDLFEERAVMTFATHTNRTITGLSFDSHGQRLVALDWAWDAKLICWDLASGRQRSSFDMGVGALCWNVSSDARWVALGNAAGSAMIRDLAAGQLVHLQADTAAAPIKGVALLSGGAVLATGGQDGCIRLWDVSQRRPLATLRGQMSGVQYLSASPDGRRLASGGTRPSEAVRLWDVATRQDLLTLEASGSLFGFTGFSPDGNILAAVNDQMIVHLWRAPSWAEIEAAEKGKLPSR